MAQNSNAICLYTYFVSYNFQAAKGTGFGSCTLDRGKRIEGVEDIKEMQQYIAASNDFIAVVILNYILIKSPFMEV